MVVVDIQSHDEYHELMAQPLAASLTWLKIIAINIKLTIPIKVSKSQLLHTLIRPHISASERASVQSNNSRRQFKCKFICDA
jgi:hypothetical protein